MKRIVENFDKLILENILKDFDNIALIEEIENFDDFSLNFEINVDEIDDDKINRLDKIIWFMIVS